MQKLLCVLILSISIALSLSAQGITFQGTIDAGPSSGPWMYDSEDGTPYHHDYTCELMACDPPHLWDCGAYAYRNIEWNPNGAVFNNFDCCWNGGQLGSGHTSSGICTAENTDAVNGIAGVTVFFDNYSLSIVQKINWGIMGSSGDHRVYTGGSGYIAVNGTPVLICTDGVIELDVNWPALVGSGGVDGITTGWGQATIDIDNSDPDWVAAFNNNGQVDFNFTSFDPVIQHCYAAYDYVLDIVPAQNQALPQIQAIPGVGPLDFNIPGVLVNVDAFNVGGGINQFSVIRRNENPGGALPMGINDICPYVFWEIGHVLDSVQADLTFDLTGIPSLGTLTDLRVLHREQPSDPWTEYADITLVDATHLRANNVNAFSEWGLGTVGDDPLPVTLSAFSAAVTDDNEVDITWKTLSESELLGFNVYRGEDTGFETAQFINPVLISSENSSSGHEYTLTDHHVEPSHTYYYWLEAVNFDGTTGIFGYRVARTNSMGHDPEDPPSGDYLTMLHSVAPNPFNPETHIYFELAQPEDVEILIFNTRGQTVKRFLETALPAGPHTLTWNGKDNGGTPLASGVYFLRFKAGNHNGYRTLTLLK